MKTIFITCFRGIISRNILATDALELLTRRGDIRMVIIAPEMRTKILKEEFQRGNVIIEGIAGASEKRIEKRSARLMWVIATNLLATKTRRIQRKVKFAQDGNIVDYLSSCAVAFLGRCRLVRNFFRFAWRHMVDYKEFDYLFEKYRPALVFATDVYTLDDVKLMLCAHRRGIKTVGMVRSWDNVTSKTLLCHIPAHMVVNSRRIKEEVMYYGDVAEERIFITGVPHYDHYRPEKCLPRRAFLKKYGLAEKEKLILLAAPSDVYLKNNPITPLAIKALEKVKTKILVRLPLVGKADLHSSAAALKEIPSNIVFDDPGMYPDFIDAHLSPEADRHLANCLNAADVVVTWASTMIIDAAVFNKPVILLGFDATPRPYYESIIRYYDYEHHWPVLENNAARLAKTTDELVRWVNQYLENPRLDEEGRKMIVREYCGPADGRSGERLGNFLLGQLGYWPFQP